MQVIRDIIPCLIVLPHKQLGMHSQSELVMIITEASNIPPSKHALNARKGHDVDDHSALSDYQTYLPG